MPTTETASSPVVPVTALYGANASGKSNLIDGLLFMRDAVLRSFAQWHMDGGVPRKPFRLGEGDEPSVFVVELVVQGVPYTYGFAVGNDAVLEEWLYSYPEKRRRKIFERDGGQLTFGSTLSGELRAKFKLLEELIRPNALFLSGCATTRLDAVMPVFQWFQSDLLIRRLDATRRTEKLARSTQRFIQESPEKRDRLLSLLKAADVAITDVRLEEVEDPRRRGQVSLAESTDNKRLRESFMDPNRTELKLVHEALGEPLDLEDESAGTRNWLELLPTVLGALDAGQTVVVDEIDASLHPLLTAQLIGLFQDETVNPHHAQLIFTTHDTSLLSNMLGDDILRREQVWFVEKNKSGESSVYPLSDFKPRKDQNTERRYLGGRYGAVPILDSQQVTDAVLGS